MKKRTALRRILEIDPDTVVDDVWWEYFIDDLDKLIALLVVFDCYDYKEFLDKHEGSTIEELINDLEHKHV